MKLALFAVHIVGSGAGNKTTKQYKAMHLILCCQFYNLIAKPLNNISNPVLTLLNHGNRTILLKITP